MGRPTPITNSVVPTIASPTALDPHVVGGKTRPVIGADEARSPHPLAWFYEGACW
ncbi:MAG: hypothetical protein GY788_29425 [bacterium]|nr:hypothetical protein [bacterium]